MRRLLAIALSAAACGGSQPPVNEPLPGDSHETVTAPEAPDAPAAGDPTVVGPRPGEPTPDAGVAPVAPSVSSFEIQNGSADRPLNFGTTKGWGPLIFAYTGKPPKAKAVILFESACTASCDSAPEELCPECKEPETKKEELAMARLESVPPGGTLRVPWDGKVRVYQKAPGGRKGCKCFKTIDPTEGAYTVKACGLRPPTEPGKPSTPVCTETQMVVGPGTPVPPSITLSFKK
jgi:hypothetical protein